MFHIGQKVRIVPPPADHKYRDHWPTADLQRHLGKVVDITGGPFPHEVVFIDAIMYRTSLDGEMINEVCLEPIDDDEASWDEIEKLTNWNPNKEPIYTQIMAPEDVSA